MAITGLMSLLFQKLKFILNVLFQILPTDFDWDFSVYLTVMEKQRAVIDPNSCWLQSRIDSIYIVKNVVGRIDKETSCNTIKLLYLLVVNLGELTGSHWEIYVLGCNLTGNLIRNHHTSKNVLLTIIIVSGTDEGINLELFLLLCAVQDKIGTVQHEVADLVSLTTKTGLNKFQDQPSQARTWGQYFASFLHIFLGLINHSDIIFDLTPLARPLPIELFDRRFYFTEITKCNRCLRNRFQPLLPLE